jgi:purine-binding chemotaxis protein CheW
MSEAALFIKGGLAPDSRTLLSFRLGAQIYAFAVESIVQIVSMVTITSLPQLDETVEGVINVQGRVVPVVNMRRHLGLAKIQYDLYTPILLIHSGDLILGLIVDEVLDVLSLCLEEFIPATEILPGDLGKAPVVRDLVRTGGVMTLVLDPEQLFLPNQREALGRAAKWMLELSAEVDQQAPAWEDAKSWTGPEAGA